MYTHWIITVYQDKEGTCFVFVISVLIWKQIKHHNSQLGKLVLDCHKDTINEICGRFFFFPRFMNEYFCIVRLKKISYKSFEYIVIERFFFFQNFQNHSGIWRNSFYSLLPEFNLKSDLKNKFNFGVISFYISWQPRLVNENLFVFEPKSFFLYQNMQWNDCQSFISHYQDCHYPKKCHIMRCKRILHTKFK